jgi:Flp pilus assembly protein TadD
VSLPSQAAPGAAGDLSPESLEAFMTKVRHLSTEARPPRAAATTIEGTDALLAAAAFTADAAPSPRTLLAAAAEYRRVGIFDRAHGFLQKALALAPGDAAIHDAMARLWRDAGLPHLALGDAHRAVYFAPRSPEPRNTLGTVLQALGRRTDARLQYEHALRLDPSAAYALNNLCYAWILERRSDNAVSACREALALQPTLSAARNNLGLAHAAAGDLGEARAAFDETGQPAQALYNIGIVHLAQRRFSAAIRSFEAASAAKPLFVTAGRRAQQAVLAARAAGE